MRYALKWTAAAVLAVGLTAAAQPPGGMRMMGGAGGPAQLLRSKTVRDELKVTDDQEAKLKDWGREYMAKAGEKMKEMFGKLQDVPQEDRREKMAEMMAEAGKETYKELAAVLKDDQVKRLRQIDHQVSGLRAFSTPDVRDALKLTDDQKAKLKDETDGVMRETRELMQEYGFEPGSRPDPDKMREFQKKQAGLAKEAMTKVMGMLTDDQKAAWKELTGAPVDVAKVQAEAGAGGAMRKKKDD